MTITIDGPNAFRPLVGQHVGYSDYVEITQDQVNLFAEATGDFQWIHVDVERSQTGPFGGTIAHGYLTLSLGPVLMRQVLDVVNVGFGVNYGTEKVRFPSPVPVGSKLRMGIKVLRCDDIPGGVQVALEFTFEVEGAAKPSCVAEVLYRYVV
jgi:acyl dehydratase